MRDQIKDGTIGPVMLKDEVLEGLDKPGSVGLGGDFLAGLRAQVEQALVENHRVFVDSLTKHGEVIREFRSLSISVEDGVSNLSFKFAPMCLESQIALRHTI